MPLIRVAPKARRSRQTRKRRRLLLESLEVRQVLAPVVSGLEPPAASHTAAVSSDLEVTFTEALNAGTVTDQTLVVHGQQTGRLLGSGGSSFSALGTTATVDPGADFAAGEQIQGTVTAGILNGAGQAAAPHVWQFRTGVSGGTGIFDSGAALAAANSNDIQLGDFDGDRDLDAFVVNGNEPNRVWINLGGAQGGTPGNFSDHGLSLGAYNSYRVSLGDVDGDGDLDAFVANNGQGNRVWINQGGAQPGPAGVFLDSGQSLGTYASLNVQLGDVDGDGDLDAFVVNSYQGNRVWLNQGGLQSGTEGVFSDSNQAMGTAASYGVSLGDVDGDGDLDAMVANLGVGNRVWVNQGGAQSGPPGVFSDSGQSLGDSISTGVQLGDLDGDGDLDAFVSNYNVLKGDRVWVNQGGSQGGTAGEFSDSGQNLGRLRSWAVSLGDIDGDGDLDAFMSNFNQANRVWLNQGGVQSGVAGTFVDGGQSLGTAYTYSSALGDVDGDGDLDAVAANYNQPSQVWINRNVDYGDAPDSFGTSSSRNGARHNPVGPTLGSTRDAETDGQPSADATGDDARDSGAADDEDGVTFAAVAVGQLDAQVTVDVGGSAGLLDAWVDFNNDGVFLSAGEQIADSLAVVVGANQLLFDVPADSISGQTLFARFRLSTAGGLGPHGLADDGEVEDHTITLNAPGGMATFGDSEQSLGADTSTDVALQDLDGDGDLDAWVANFGQANRVWINQGGTSGTYSDSGQALGTSQSTAVALGDVDGDGDADAVTANSNQADRVYLNQGGTQGGVAGTFSDSGQFLGTASSLDVALGDLDIDGDLDAFFAEFAGNRVWLNQGAAQGGTQGEFSNSGQDLGSMPSYGVSLGDLDADGDLDAFIANNGANRIWWNQGGLQSGSLGVFSDSGQSLGASQSYGAVLGDVDGDGDLDALVANNGQPNLLWINQGGSQSGTAGMFSDSGQSLGGGNSSEISLADLDGDGDLDALVANSGGQADRVWINQGAAQNGTPGVFSDSGQSLGTSNSSNVSLGDIDGDGDLDAFITNRNEGNRVWLNQGQPTVTNHIVNDGLANRSKVLSVALQFDQPVTVNTAASLRFFNHTTDAPFDANGAQLQNNGSNLLTWDLTNVNFPDGYYTAELAHTQTTGAALAKTYAFEFHVLAGDSDGDRSVGFGDFSDLASKFNTVNGPLLGPGDLNGDGDVNFGDFAILAGEFNNSISAPAMDFGDAPETGTSFPTTLPTGARHMLGSTLFLGGGVDGEADGQPDANATGDDNAGDDEDGVVFGTLQVGATAALTVTAALPVGGQGLLNGWVDFNGDGDWNDAGEQVFVNEALANGTNNLTAAIPASATTGSSFARFRITSSPGYSYLGLAPDGEVEDYQITLVSAAAARFTAHVPGGPVWNQTLVDKLRTVSVPALGSGPAAVLDLGARVDADLQTPSAPATNRDIRRPRVSAIQEKQIDRALADLLGAAAQDSDTLIE